MTLATTAHGRPPGGQSPVGVLGTGSYLPGHVVGNDEAGEPAGVDDAWIVRKTGIRARRWAKPDEATSDLAAAAGRAALKNAGISARDLSLVVVATSTPDTPQPPTAAVVADLIGATPATAAFDLNAVCSGFVFALSVVQRTLLASGGHALVIGADIYSRILDRTDRRTTVLFGDGAGAVVLGPTDAGRGVLATHLATFPAYRDLIEVAAGGSRRPASAETLADGSHYFRMNGRAVREFVAEHVPPAVHEMLRRAGVRPDQIDHLVPHQANAIMLDELTDALGLPNARLHTTVADYGNTGAASVPVTLDAAVASGAVRPGDLALLAGFGGGMAAGLALVRC
ncbi:3-oxoacyl-ACP synthase III family protein [Streptomyces endophytica]|uniref:Ketoacyl-ACP synthase III n=1 Tax=Streptomyces endophytica TaxID=2991496 RepID=A0ABY6P896_9ACTN|nr:ketoacyl-ACP synthase III [Streptomyces endophytica]UZJ29472.1 ketoacyl-ACP synthase III [Streptomyces endophytica]